MMVLDRRSHSSLEHFVEECRRAQNINYRDCSNDLSVQEMGLKDPIRE